MNNPTDTPNTAESWEERRDREHRERLARCTALSEALAPLLDPAFGPWKPELDPAFHYETFSIAATHEVESGINLNRYRDRWNISLYSRSHPKYDTAALFYHLPNPKELPKEITVAVSKTP